MPEHQDAVQFRAHPPRTKRSTCPSLQFVRKLSGFTRPSQANQAAFDRAVEKVLRSCARADRTRSSPTRRRGIAAVEAMKAQRPGSAERFRALSREPQVLASMNWGARAGFTIGSAGAAGDARRLRHHQRQVELELIDFVRTTLAEPRRRRDRCPLAGRGEGEPVRHHRARRRWRHRAFRP